MDDMPVIVAIEFHPLANEFPLMQEAELNELIVSIKKRGLIEPIIMHEGKILDGRNRYRACEAADVAAIFEDYTGNDPLGFVIAKNLDRRHLTTSQRAMIAARLANMSQGERTDLRSIDGRSDEALISQGDAAAALKVSAPSVVRANRILKQGTPDEIAAVESGERTINDVQADIAARNHDGSRKVGARINVPEGETVESAVRSGMLSGGSIAAAARDMGMNPGTYAKVSDVLRLLDMDLAEADKALCRSVMDEINETLRIRPHDRLASLIRRVWGEEKHVNGLETKRLEAFRRALGVVFQAVNGLPKVEIPYLGEDELREMSEELKAAEGKVRSFRNALKEAHK